MRLFVALFAIAFLFACDDGVESPGTAADATVASDVGALTDGELADAGMTSDATQTADAESGQLDAATDADTDPGDAELSPDADAVDSGQAELMPVEPCGDDLQVVCGSVTPNLGDVPAVDSAGIDPSETGSYDVQTTATQINGPQGDEIPITIYEPYADDEPLAGPLPLVILLPGFGFSHTGYPHFTEHLASHGFIVVGADVATGGFMEAAVHDEKTAKVLAVLNWAISDSPVANRLDGTRIASVGHSLGGKLSFYAAALDSRIDLVVAWDPQNGGGPPCFLGDTGQGSCNDYPVAPNCEGNDSGIIHQIKAESLTFGAEDLFITPDVHLRADRFYRGAPSPAHFVSMPAAGHAAWSNGGDVSVLSRGVHTALLLNRMQGVRGLDEWLPGGARLEMAASVDAVYSK